MTLTCLHAVPLIALRTRVVVSVPAGRVPRRAGRTSADTVDACRRVRSRAAVRGSGAA
jgi:hypothetical protein